MTQPMPYQSPYNVIQHPEQLSALSASARHTQRMAIDTEFVRESTYYPHFCLLQIAFEGHIALIDPLNLPSLEPLAVLLQDPSIQKIVHAGRQDFEVLHQQFGFLPTSIIDTQLLAGLLGLPDQIGYANLMQETLGVTLPKDHTRTDWSQRPLSTAQLDYAADDVRYLAMAVEPLLATLDQLGRLPWLEEDCKSLVDPSLYENDPAESWKRVSGIADLESTAFDEAKIIAQWREETAKALNIPRTWVVRDDTLCHMARQPNPTAGASRIRGADEITQKKALASLTSLLETTQRQEGNFKPNPLAAKADPSRRALIKQMAGIIQTEAGHLQITPSVIGSRKDIEQLIDDPKTSRLHRGWRHSRVGPQLLELIEKFEG